MSSRTGYKRKRTATGTTSRRRTHRRVGTASRRSRTSRVTRRPATRRRSTYSTIGRTMGQAVGGMIAPGIIGSGAGGILGAGAGALIDRITGQGDYTIKSNTLIKAAPVPSFGKGCIRVKHREMLANILSSTAFNLQGININPGLADSFPWLSQIAINFEMYKFHGLIFEYVSTSGDALNSTNTALGKIIMATDYNVLDPVYDNEQQMYATEFSNSGKPATNLLHAVECSPMENPLKLYYIRSGSAPLTGDQRFYDLGKFQIAVNGCQSVGNQIGELWVSYDVSLCKPSLQAVQLGEELLAGHARLVDYSGVTGPFLAVNNMEMLSGSNISYNNSTTNTVVFDPKITTQRMMLYFDWVVQSAITCPDLSLSFSIAQGSGVSFFQNQAVTLCRVPNSGATNCFAYSACIVVDANAPGSSQMSITFNNSLTFGDIIAFDLVAVQIPSQLT